MAPAFVRRLLVVAGFVAAGPVCLAAPSHGWQLGNGFYAPYLQNAVDALGELDLARWDWLVVEMDGPDTVKLMNRLLEINPKLKFSARVWPINGLGNPELYSSTASCLDYLLYPEKRAEIDKQTHAAVRGLREGLRNWDSVVCFTFLEEIPGWWGCGELAHYDGTGPLPRILQIHQAAIERARGKPLVWDAETKRWLGQQFTESMAAIHRIIKAESGGKPVIYWHHTNFATLDDLPDPLPGGFDLVKWGGYPVYFRDIIQPGLCDGIMAYPNNARIWEDKYMRHVRQHGWQYFSQLSHPSFMRLSSWADAEQMVLAKNPQNLGYFLYCEGPCAAKGAWNDDPSVPRDPAWNTGRSAAALHSRLIARQQKVGFDVVKRYLHLRVSLDVDLEHLKPGAVPHLVALIENPKDPTYYDDPADAVARAVKVRLTLPGGLDADQNITAATALSIGDIPAGGRKIVDWWLTVKDSRPLQSGKALQVSATSANTDPGAAATAASTTFPSLVAHPVTCSGAAWDENGFRYGGLQPAVELVATGAPIRNPTLTDGSHTLTYGGEIWAGMSLVITPDLKARVYPSNLLPENLDALKDPDDPTGYKGFTEGYGVAAFYIQRYVRPGARYTLTLSGRAAGGGNSLAVLRAVKPNREAWMESFVANAFGEAWGQPNQTFTMPNDVDSLERIYLYRFQSKGKVWYGPMSLVPADLPADGLDVSDKVSGRPLQIEGGGLTRITYGDASPDATSPKVQVRLLKPEDARLQVRGPGPL
ncbi:MAG: hypothetical protein HYU66_03150 [Armatimonadetes bacterium]|nr:hypothetical protein [Armatimonadota bacterium]